MQSLTIYFRSQEALDQFSAWLLKEGQNQYYEDCLYDDKPTIDLKETEFKRNPAIVCLFAIETGDKREDVHTTDNNI